MTMDALVMACLRLFVSLGPQGTSVSPLEGSGATQFRQSGCLAIAKGVADPGGVTPLMP